MGSPYHRDIILCDCEQPEHQVIVRYDKVDDDQWPAELFFSVHLTKKPFWQRVAYSIRYILGRQSKYGAFDEVIVSPDEAKRLKNHIEEYLKIRSS